MVMVMTSYGLNSSVESWRKIFAETLRSMGFVPTVADPDIYHRGARKPNGKYYYGFLLVYVDDVLCCLRNDQLIIDALALTYYLKNGSVVSSKI